MQKKKKKEREKDPHAIQCTGHLLFYSLESTVPDYLQPKRAETATHSSVM